MILYFTNNCFPYSHASKPVLYIPPNHVIIKHWMNRGAWSTVYCRKHFLPKIAWAAAILVYDWLLVLTLQCVVYWHIDILCGLTWHLFQHCSSKLFIHVALTCWLNGVCSHHCTKPTAPHPSPIPPRNTNPSTSLPAKQHLCPGAHSDHTPAVSVVCKSCLGWIKKVVYAVYIAVLPTINWCDVWKYI